MQNSSRRNRNSGAPQVESDVESHGKRLIPRPTRTSSQLGPIADQMARGTKRFLRSFQENLQLATVLAVVAGLVNAISFLEFGTFVSHISGNATHVAIEYATSHGSLALIFLFEILCFIFGALLTSLLLRGHTAASSRVKYTSPVLIEAALLLLFMYSVNRLGKGNGQVTLLLSTAMGMQNAMLRQASGAIVRTTHMTGVATDIGIELGAALSSALHLWRRSGWMKGFLIFFAAFAHRLGGGRFAFQSIIFLSFIAGGVIGTLGHHLFQASILLLPILVLTLVALKEHLRPRTEA